MTKEQQCVREWMIMAGQDSPDKPTLPNNSVCHLRLKLVKEEWGELAEDFMSGDVVRIADSIGDLLYVILGTAVACGIDLEPVFQEIHRSNMTKFADGVNVREDGKILKGPSYQPPSLAPIIEAQQSQPKYECRICGEDHPENICPTIP